MTSIFVDTLFIVALANPRDQYHKLALSLSQTYERHPLIMTDCVLLEVGNALARRFKSQAAEIIEEFQNSKEADIVPLTPVLFQKGLDLYKCHQDKSWGLVDCISFVVMEESSIDSALTFDQHFIQAGFRALMREDIV